MIGTENGLPINLAPNAEARIGIDSFVTQPLTSLLVLVFVFKNKKRKNTLFLCKEIVSKSYLGKLQI